MLYRQGFIWYLIQLFDYFLIGGFVAPLVDLLIYQILGKTYLGYVVSEIFYPTK
jgi:hypothetical protein